MKCYSMQENTKTETLLRKMSQRNVNKLIGTNIPDITGKGMQRYNSKFDRNNII